MLTSAPPNLMWHVVHLIVRPLEVLLGLFCIVTAVFLYPDQEGQIQSFLEDVWIRSHDIQKAALSRHASLMVAIAESETEFLDWIFGDDLMSQRAFVVSLICSTVSVMSVRLVKHSVVFEAQAFAEWELIARIGLLAFYVFFSLWLVSKNEGALNILTCILACILLPLAVVPPGELYSFYRRGLSVWTAFRAGSIDVWIRGMWAWTHANRVMVEQLFCIFLLSFSCDVAFIIITRIVLRKSSKMRSVPSIVFAMAVLLGLSLVLISPLLMAQPIGKLFGDSFAVVVYLIGASNIFDLALSLLFVVFLALLLLHFGFWPLLTRTLFRMQDIGTKSRRGVLILMGSALLSGKFDDLAQKLIEKLGG